MITRASRHVLNLSNPVVTDIGVQAGSGSKIDNVPIGTITPNVGHFTNVVTETITITNSQYLTDAPSNGQTYGRRNQAWSVVAEPDLSNYVEEAPDNANRYVRTGASGGSWVNLSTILSSHPTEAPADSVTYGRRNNAWVNLSSTYLTDAASDGNLYGRKNAAWVSIPSSAWVESFTTDIFELNTAMVLDSTDPTTTEGTQIASIANVVVGSGEKVEIHVDINAFMLNSPSLMFALFRGSTCVAARTATYYTSVDGGNADAVSVFHIFHDAPSAGTYTYSLRAGSTKTTDNWLNARDQTGTRMFTTATLKSGMRLRKI